MTALADQLHRIAIVRLSALGDVVNTLPVLTALRRARPDAHIAWVCETASAGLLDGHPMLDQLIVVRRKRWARAAARLYGLLTVPRELWALARTLRRSRFDAAIDCQGNLRSALITYHTRAPIRVGPAATHAKEGSHRLTTHHVAMPHGPLHRVERALRLVQALGIDTADAHPLVPATDADRHRIDRFLRAGGLDGESFAVIHAGTSPFGRYKQWPADRWAKAARRLVAEHRLRVVLTHGPGRAETQAAESLAEEAGRGAVAAPLLSLRELGELFRRCRLFLSVDTGPMHLASAVGAPVVALFGPKDPAVNGPYFAPRAIVERPLPCRPCRKRSCHDPRCMLDLTPDDLLEATASLLSSLND